MDMGFGELLMILLVALIIFGPDKLPQIARKLGETVAMLRKTSQDISYQLRKELDAEIEKPKPPTHRKSLPAEEDETEQISENSHLPSPDNAADEEEQPEEVTENKNQ